VVEQNDERRVGHHCLSNHFLDTILTDYKQDNDKQEAWELTAA
jgi:hypothetical protein